MRSGALFLLLLAGGAWSGAPIEGALAQEPAGGSAAEESELDRLLRLARSGSAVVRPQAAQKLTELGEPARLRLRELALASPDDLAELGPEITEVLADFGDAELRARLWSALGDPDFPWRPAAGRSLARSPLPIESGRFEAALADPLASVRETAVDALERLGRHEARAAVEALLADPDDRVRRAAARCLLGWGEPCALVWLLQDLRRDDRWFELQTGKLARYQAVATIRKSLGQELGAAFSFEPERPWEDPRNAEGRAFLLAWLAEHCPEPPDLPAVALPAEASAGDLIGLEIRSCRRGEYFLRWNERDELLVGTGNALRIALPEGTVARLCAAVGQALESLGRERLWGEPGCDSELFLFRADPAGRSTSYRVSKGYRAVEGLRPAALGKLQALLLETLPEDGDDPRTARLRERVREALAAVGGPLTEAPSEGE